MKNLVTKLLFICALVLTVFIPSVEAVSENAECLDVQSKDGNLTITVCVEGDIASTKIRGPLKSEVLGLLHKFKKEAKAQKVEAQKAEKTKGGNSGQTPKPKKNEKEDEHHGYSTDDEHVDYTTPTDEEYATYTGEIDDEYVGYTTPTEEEYAAYVEQIEDEYVAYTAPTEAEYAEYVQSSNNYTGSPDYNESYDESYYWN